MVKRLRTDHERRSDWVHPVIAKFMGQFYTWADTSARQNFIGIGRAGAFQKQMLPIKMLKGPGEIVFKQALATAPQAYVQQTPLPTGIAGIATGQIWNGGMTDNPNMGDNLSGEIV